MTKDRALSKTEASLGLTLLAGLLVTLGGVYVYRFDEPTPVTPPDPNWIVTPPAAAGDGAPVERTSTRPEWLTPQSQPPQTAVR